MQTTNELLLSKDKYELSTLAEVQASCSNQERYVLSNQKSKIVTFNQKKGDKEECLDVCKLNGEVVETVESYTCTHIGVIRHSKPSTNLCLEIEEAIKTARKTAYSLMGRVFTG